ncbi:hypothetical protein QF004_001989 [Chryseobacterium sp. MDT2-18]|nr:hypothetical protein [Chryseobacterium sp. MDT2-18]
MGSLPSVSSAGLQESNSNTMSIAVHDNNLSVFMFGINLVNNPGRVFKEFLSEFIGGYSEKKEKDEVICKLSRCLIYKINRLFSAMLLYIIASYLSV